MKPSSSILTTIRLSGISVEGNVSIADKETPDRIRHDGTIAYMRGPLDRVASQMDIQINLPKMRQGGVDAAFFAIDVTRAWKNHLSYALDAIGFFKAEVETHADEIIIAKTAEDVREGKSGGQTCCDFGH